MASVSFAAFALPQGATHASDYFTGCLRNIHINGIPVNWHALHNLVDVHVGACPVSSPPGGVRWEVTSSIGGRSLTINLVNCLCVCHTYHTVLVNMTAGWDGNKHTVLVAVIAIQEGKKCAVFPDIVWCEMKINMRCAWAQVRCAMEAMIETSVQFEQEVSEIHT